MQATLVNQRASESQDTSREDATSGVLTSGSGATLVLQAQLEAFDGLEASARVFRSLRAYVREYPGELTAQLGDLERQQPSIKARRDDLPATAPSVKALIFSVNFDHFQNEGAQAEGSDKEVSFAA